MTHDPFAHKADSFDTNPVRVDNVASIADAIRAAIPLDPTMHLVDFGSGTGLLLERIAPYVGRITAVDVSPSMNAQLEAKFGQLACPVELHAIDLVATDLPGRYDGVISSMTMHHIADVADLFGKFRAMLKPGGFIAIADLDAEDGSFHSEDTGVFHNGFEREAIAALAAAAGFADVVVRAASVVRKPQRDYPVFLLTARA